MSDILVTGQEAYFNENVTFFKNVFFNSIDSPVEFGGAVNFRGPANFYGDVNFDGGRINNLTVLKKLSVGADGTTLVADAAAGKVGIGSLIPQQKLDILGNIKISSQIYDATNSPGPLGGFLTKDNEGIKWTALEPSFTEGIFVYNEGVLAGVQSYRGLNFRNVNGSGIAIDPVQAITNTSNPSIADVNLYNFWEVASGTSNIYRNSNVGINNPDPVYTLDVVGTVNIDGNLYVEQSAEFYRTLNVYGASRIYNSLSVDYGVTIGETLNVTKNATIEGLLDVNDGAIIDNIRIGISNNNTIDTSTGSLILNSGNGTIIIGDTLDDSLNIAGNTTISGLLDVNSGATIDNIRIGIADDNTIDTSTGNLRINSDGGTTTIDDQLIVSGATTLNDTLNVNQATYLNSSLNVSGITSLTSSLSVGGNVTFNSTTNSTNKSTGALIIKGGVGIGSNLNVGGNTKIGGTLKLDSSLIDINGSTAIGKTDYRLASVGTGVSWRPPGVQTKRSIWVTLNGDDSNSGLLEGDAKRTIGAGASIAEPGDTIIVRSGVYYENNPIGLRTDVCLSGQDLRLVTIIPNNPTKDVFHVRRGCLIENLSFAGSNISVAHTGAGAVAFPPINPSQYAISGYIAPGPATEGETGRWKSPYVRNCTNFMSRSIGMKINGDHATASTIGANLKCMVLDSFTQYNEAGIGVSITNNGYAQLVSLFTIASDIAVYVDSGGQCDLTNSNSSFGNYGLYAVGVGATEFTGNVLTATTEETDTIVFTNVSDEFIDIRKPYDGQALFFKLNLADYNTGQTGITSAPMKRLLKIDVINGGSGYSQVSPPDVAIYDINTNENVPLGPEGIIAEVSSTVGDDGSITAVDVVNGGRNYLATQNIGVKINGTPTNDLVAVMESIYYTVLEATESTLAVGANGRYADAVNLILDNLDFIATEAVDRMLANFPTFTIPGGNSKCIADVKLVLKKICHNLQFGGNDKTYDAAKYYIDHPVLLAGEQNESIYTYERARDLAKLIITNQTITKQNPSSNTYTQVKNLSLIADSGTGSNTSPLSCTNVQDAINTLVGIVTFAINPTSPSLPLNRTVGGNNVGVTTVTFNEFVPYLVSAGTEFELRRISRILTSGHSFEYIGAGTSINNSTPQGGGVPIKSNEVVALDGAQIPYTSTDQRGNFNIGAGIQINQTTASITGRDFSKAIQAEVTPLILALR